MLPPRRPARIFLRALAAAIAPLLLGTVTRAQEAIAAGSVDDAPAFGILVPKGPLPHRNSEPLNTPFLTPPAADARVLRKGLGRLDVRLDIVNNLLNLNEGPRRYLVDFEEQRLYLGYARGIGSGQEIGLSLVYVSRNGGWLDHFIDSWHKVFGFEGGGRGNIPRNRTLFRVTDAAGQVIIDDSVSRSGFGDTLLEYRRELQRLPAAVERTRRIGLAARALLKLPTGNRNHLLGSGKTDFGLGLTATARPLRNLAVHGNASLVFTGGASNPALRPERTLVHSLVAAEYLFDGRTSAVIQTDDNPAPFRSGFSYADRPRRAFTFGFWRDIGHGGQIFLLNSENDFGALAKYAPDFVLSLGTRWLLK
ncbi:MAG: DUF3187 family protein [Capsulimonadales bacterium]|nr:DUF3187 family protein [Capsulimonadales bacterium]